MALPMFYPYDQTPRSEYDAMGGQGNSPLAAGFRALASHGEKNASVVAASEPVRKATEVTLALPAVTQNAVTGAAAARSNTVAPGGNYEGAYLKQKAERGVGSMGAPPTPKGSLGGVADNGAKFTLTPTGRGGIDRIDEQGKSPLFTNMGLAGRDDLAKMRDPLPSIPEVLRGVPEMQSSFRAQAGGGGGLVSPQPRVIGMPTAIPGMPGMHSAPTFIPGDGSTGPTILGGGGNRFAEIDAQIDKYTRPGSSIFDQWRGRQLEKRRDKLALHESLIANSLANMTNAQTGQQKLGVDSQNALLNAMAHKYSADASAQAHERSAMYGLLPHLGKMAMERRMNTYLDAGDTASAARLAAIQHPSAPQRPTNVPADAFGNISYVDSSGQLVTTSVKAQQEAAAAAERARRQDAATGAR